MEFLDVVKRILVVGAGLWLLAAGLMIVFQRALMYFPDTTQQSPADAGFAKARTLALTTSDKETIQAWYMPAKASARLFLYFHGNGGSMAGRVRRFAALTADGSGLLAIDYRGYGGSTGTPTEEGLIRDAEAAYAEARALGYGPERIVLLGESLGTGVAVALAAAHPVAGLVLDAPYSATVDIAATRYWMFPVRMVMRDTFRSDLRVAKIHAPILMLHGSDDPIIPIRFGERLFALANEPKTFVHVAGGGHTVLWRPDVSLRLRDWLATALPPIKAP